MKPSKYLTILPIGEKYWLVYAAMHDKFVVVSQAAYPNLNATDITAAEGTLREDLKNADALIAKERNEEAEPKQCFASLNDL